MEEIAFGVVSTAYENWSYDDSGSDLEPLVFDSPHLKNYGNHLSSSKYSGNGSFMPTNDSTDAPPVTENLADSWSDRQVVYDDTQYEMNS